MSWRGSSAVALVCTASLRARSAVQCLLWCGVRLAVHGLALLVPWLELLCAAFVALCRGGLHVFAKGTRSGPMGPPDMRVGCPVGLAMF